MRITPLTLSSRLRRGPVLAVASAGAVAGVVLLSASALADVPSTRAIHRSAQPAAIRPCTAAQTRVWLGDGPGGGTAGTIYYPLEFSNAGHARCTLYGYPGVSAYGSSGKQIGQPATRITSAHGTVTLAPGATAHVLLGIRDWGAICSKQVHAQGLKVYAPGQRSATSIGFPFGACAKASVLVVEPVRKGVGIPGDTTS